MDNEENISTEPIGAQAPSWFPPPHGRSERTQGACPPPGQGAQAPFGVTGHACDAGLKLVIGRLKKRRDFLAAAQGSKAARRAFVLEARERGDDGPPRFGFTVTKRVARKSVERNRIRRRLREAVRLDAENAQNGHDYVLVGRRKALTESFTDLKAALGQALRQTADFPNSGRDGDARRTGR
jgi:ribonuclease P protein component